MAEALDLAASIIGVLQLAGTVINACYTYQSGVRSAPKDLRRVFDQLIGLRTILENLLSLAQNNTSSSQLSALKLLNVPGGPLPMCISELNALKEKLEPARGWRGKLDVLKWPLNESETNKTLSHLERTKSTIQIALTSDQTALMLTLQNNLANAQDTFTSGLSRLEQRVEIAGLDELHQKIRQWLSPPDPSTNHNDACAKQRDGTCSWFIDGEELQKWKVTLASSLCLYGNAGCGKTILCSKIIEDIARSCGNQALHAVIYFYFVFNDDHKQHCDDLLRSIISQLSAKFSSVPDALGKIYSQSQNGERQPSRRDLKATLRALLGAFRQVYIVLDALDESQEREEMLDLLTEIASWRLDGVHILATSRKERDIEKRLENWHPVDINYTMVNEDIRLHIREVLGGYFRLNKWPVTVQDETETALVDGAKGMFRWVVCQLDVLRKCVSPGQLRKALRSLPTTLDETYARILNDIDENFKADALRILQWLAFSARPISVNEMLDVLAIDMESLHYDPSERIPDPKDLVGLCSSLVAVSSSTIDYYTGEEESFGENVCHPLEARVLSLAHFTVKEYLLSDRVGSVAPHYRLEKRLTDTLISKACLVYLMHFDKEDCLDSETLPHFPLARYAAEFWIHHARSNGSVDLHNLQGLIEEILQPHSARYENWIRLYDPESPRRARDVNRSPINACSPLYYMSFTGMLSACKLLLDYGASVNKKEGECGSALKAAAYGGHDEVVELLLSRGADINAKGGDYGSVLQAAATEGHESTVRLLINHRADTNIQGGQFGSALQVAAYGGYESIVRLLLNSGANVNLGKAGDYGYALHAAASEGHEAIVKVLIDRGADINAYVDLHGNALHLLSLKGYEEMVRLLLDRGMDVNARGGDYGDALQAAAYGGHEAVVRLLLYRGAVVNTKRGQYGYPLQAAAVGGHASIVKIILRAGADVNARGGWHGNALQAAAFSGDLAIMQFLLDHEAEVNARGGEYGSPLQAASYGGHAAAARLLLDRGANVNIRGGTYGYALQAAALEGHEAIVRLLVERGANVNAQGGEDYGNALQAAAYGGYSSIVNFLVENRASVNADGGYYGSALQAAASQGHEDTVRTLLKLGVNINQKGGVSGSALQAAAEEGYEGLVQLLLDSHADANLVSGEYGSPLQAAAAHDHLSIVQILLDNGANVNAQGGSYGNALLAAAYEGHISIARLLLDSNANPNSRGNHYGTALRTAASEGHRTIVSLLIEKKADINVHDEKHATALYSAAVGGHESTVKVLLKHDANVNVQCGYFGSALQAAAGQGHKSIVRLLLDNGANVNAEGGKYGSALQAAVEKGHQDIVDMLKEYGSGSLMSEWSLEGLV